MPAGYIKAVAASPKLERLFMLAEQDIMADIVRRVKSAGRITSTADWQLQRMHMLGNSSKMLAAKMQSLSGASSDEISDLFAKAANYAYTRDKALYEASGLAQVPYSQNAELRQLVHAITAQTNASIYNLTRTTGFMIRGADGRLAFSDLSDIYNGYLDRNVTAMLSGAMDYNSLIRNTVRDLTSSGIRSVDYASGRHVRTDAAVRTAILTGFGQLTSQVTFMNARQLGTDKFEVSWHPAARPDHQYWQGRVYTRRQLESVCGYGRVDGLCGANCRHVFYPYIEGVSERNFSDDDLRILNEEENAYREFRGKQLNDYEASQEQRKLETAMKAYRERVELLELGDAAEEDITLAASKLKALKQQYRELCRFFRFEEQWERVYTGYVAA